MTIQSTMMLGLALFAGAAVAAQGGPELTSQQDKLSYALGMGQAETLRHFAIDVNPAVYSQGLKDALSQGKTLLTEAEARALRIALQGELKNKPPALSDKAGQGLAGKNRQEGEAFLAANKAKEGVVTLDSGLQYKILAAGDGRKPTLDDTVTVNYRGTLVDGTEFDSSYRRNQPASLSVNKVIKGWTEALQLMPVGSKWQIFVPPELAYGERGAGSKIRPNATLVFEVELVAIKDAGAAQASGGKGSAAAPSGDGINVSFKVDPRIARGLYMGDRWVSPATYINNNSSDGKTITVEARAQAVGAKGQAKWIPADPDMVTVAPMQGNEVKITVQQPGTSKLRVASDGFSKELAITAKYEAGKAIQVDITQ